MRNFLAAVDYAENHAKTRTTIETKEREQLSAHVCMCATNLYVHK
jgi:hypothetical protein